MGHSQRVSGGCKKEKSVHSLLIGFGRLSSAFGAVPDLDLYIRHNRTALIGYDAGQTAGGCGLGIQLICEGAALGYLAWQVRSG